MDYCANLLEMPRVRMLGQIRQRAGWKNAVRRLGTHLLILVRGGDMRVEAGAEVFCLKEGDYLLLKEGDGYSVSSEGSCEYVFVHFLLCAPLLPWSEEEEQARVETVTEPYGLPPSHPERVRIPMCGRLEGESERVWMLLTECDMYRYGLTPSRKLRIELRVAEVLGLLESCAEHSPGAAYPPALSRMLFHIHQRYMQELTLSSLSEEFSLSRQYVARLFQRHLHVTLTQYVTRLRLEHSLEFLRYSNLNVGEIAEAVGFASAYYFCRLFHRQFGVTPTQYRKNALSTKE